MAREFSRIMYHTMEEQLTAQLGDRRKEFTKQQWRDLMDKAMEQFAWALIAVVANFTANLKVAADEAKKAKAEEAAAVPEAPQAPAA